jgi:hypothetical protein
MNEGAVDVLTRGMILRNRLPLLCRPPPSFTRKGHAENAVVALKDGFSTYLTAARGHLSSAGNTPF